MKSFFKRGVSLIICAVMLTSAFSIAAAPTKSELQNDIAELQAEAKKIQARINQLKSEKKDQQAILDAVRAKISNTQAQINRCNKEISAINSKIAANKAEIDANNQKIEESKLAFKKRIRAIYMSNSDSNVKILLGAEDFSEYLQLSQLTASVSSHDKSIIEDIVAVIDILNQKNTENEELLKSQVAVKDTIVAQQKELEAQEKEAEDIYNGIASSQKSEEADLAENAQEIKDKQAELAKFSTGGSSYDSFINPNSGFMWPVSFTRNITSYYGGRNSPTAGASSNHKGIDISASGIYGKPIVAIADGTVYGVVSSCTHRDKSSRCRCGGGYGNYVSINHGTMQSGKYKGNRYKAIYAHMDSVTVSVGQKVKQGDVIGYVGTTGTSTGYHLHLGILENDIFVNPYGYFFS